MNSVKGMTRKRRPNAIDAVELDVFGEACGTDGYTTPAEARTLARALHLTSGARVLDIGSGAGWPGTRIAEITGARVVLSDIPRDAIVKAASRAPSCDVIAAAGYALPFRTASFDAITHADVMC